MQWRIQQRIQLLSTGVPHIFPDRIHRANDFPEIHFSLLVRPSEFDRNNYDYSISDLHINFGQIRLYGPIFHDVGLFETFYALPLL